MNSFKKRMRPLLGTYVEIGGNSCDKDIDRATTEAFVTIEHVQSLLSFHAPDSELTKLNSSLNQDLTLHPVTMVLLRLARRMTIISQGLFNFTVGGALIEKEMLPQHDLQMQRLPWGQGEDLVLTGKTAKLTRPVLITLDGIAKGYAVDLAVKKMRQCGVKNGWVNAGGDMRIFGDIILPVHRRERSGKLQRLGEFSEISLATSSIANVFDERFPGYIVSSDSTVRSDGIWTVAAPAAWLADALTKVVCGVANKDREAIVKKFGGRLIEVSQE